MLVISEEKSKLKNKIGLIVSLNERSAVIKNKMTGSL